MVKPHRTLLCHTLKKAGETACPTLWPKHFGSSVKGIASSVKGIGSSVKGIASSVRDIGSSVSSGFSSSSCGSGGAGGFACLLLLLCAPASAGIWPEQIGAAKRQSVKPVTVADQKLWSEYGLQESEQAQYDKFTAIAYRM